MSFKLLRKNYLAIVVIVIFLYWSLPYSICIFYYLCLFLWLWLIKISWCSNPYYSWYLVLSFWSKSSFFHFQVENSGDPWLQFANKQPLSYWTCIYFLVVTMSTVGYGDVYAKTVLGRIFATLFIFGGLVSWFSHL